MHWILVYITVFLIVVVLAGIIIPRILLIAFRKNLFDDEDPRKIHHGAVPRLGGIAFFPSILFAIMFVLGACQLFFPGSIGDDIKYNLATFCFIACAVIILYLVGMADDLVGVKYRAKFVAQILAALFIVAGGISLNDLYGFLWIDLLPDYAAWTLTILLVVFITNAINLIDGIDGLASGLSALACAFYGIIFFKAGLHVYAMLAFATLGALVPFFYYNVFGDPTRHSKIFMGDTGALTIGLILSVLSIRTTQIHKFDVISDPAVLAFAPLLIPCFDVVRVYLHRLKAHKSPFLPDKSHIHHKLLALGLSQRLAMPVIISASFLLIIFNYLMCTRINITLLFVIDLGVWIVANMILSRAIRRRQRRTGVILYK